MIEFSKREMIKDKLRELDCKLFHLNEKLSKCIFIYKSVFYKATLKAIYGSDCVYVLIKNCEIPETIEDLSY